MPEKIARSKSKSNRSNGNGNGNGGGNGSMPFESLSSRQLLKALRAFDQGDFSVADTLNTRKLLKALRAYQKGDFSVRLPEDQTGIAGEIAQAFNGCIELNQEMAKECARVGKMVGREGKFSERCSLEAARGSWGTQIQTYNSLIDAVVQPVGEFSDVITAISQGDLSRPMALEIEGRPLKGEFLRLAKVANTTIDQLNVFAGEVTRVAFEVGTEGILGGKANVKGVGGVWRDLTDSVNKMADNLTTQVRDIATVTTAVANGDLSQKISVEVKGEVLQLKNTINTMVDQLSAFSQEVTRVAKEVGTDGKLGGAADVKGVSGAWRELTDNVNTMANNLTSQVRNIVKVITAVANGDLSQKVSVEAKGEVLQLADTINEMVDRLGSFSEEVTRVAKEVGTDGQLGGQAEVKGVSGAWKDLTDNVNIMATNLTNQVREVAQVVTAVAKGDLTRKITADARGEVLELKNTVNIMVDQLNNFSGEVTRVAKEVGTDGLLGGQAVVEDVSGTWKVLTDNVNNMANNLTTQVRNVAEVATALANGDLSKKITVEARGEILELKNTINALVDRLNSFSREVSQIAKEVGTEGKLGGQAEVAGVAGAWKELTDNVNVMANNLTNQVRDIAQVTTAVALGDLSKNITVDAQGEVLELKNTINTMVDQLGTFSDEVTRVAKEVGTDGQLGGQAAVEGVSGAWKDLTDNVNAMASNLTEQVRDIAQVATAVANGDLNQKITVEVKGEVLQLKDTINTMVDQLSTFSDEVTRVAKEVGTEGELGGQATIGGVSGVWKDLTDNVNTMAGNLTNQVRDIAQVATAVANGDLSKKITVEVKGEVLELKDTINVMVDQLSTFSGEVTRVAKEVGTDGQLGGQAEVKDVSGVWKDLTDNVNNMATNLTDQVRDIAIVATAVADGDLSKKITVDAQGEILVLKNNINQMTETLGIFSEQVTDVAAEVGTQGKLGGQADVPDAKGVWRELTGNVNGLADNLTRQVRAIADVVTAVTQGDFERVISVEAKGEVAGLKDNINKMIGTLGETTKTNEEQDWLKSNLSKFIATMQGKKDLQDLARSLISDLAPLISAQLGVFYQLTTDEKEDAVLKLLAGYGYKERKTLSSSFKIGEGLVGQCAFEKQRILVSDVPDKYIQISSGLGSEKPAFLLLLPILFEEEVIGVIELASFQKFTDIQLAFLEQLTVNIGIVVNGVTANMRTDVLLKESQTLTEELQSQTEELQSQQEELTETNQKLEQQASTLKKSEDQLKSQQEELQQTNEELEEKAKLLSDQKTEVESKNKEVEQAKVALEDKAEQLALTSKYKSEFLANMSHELRTPLNSLLILSESLSKNKSNNLSEKQVEFATTIHSSGAELLNLINEILDLSKIESGSMSVEIGHVLFRDLKNTAQSGFNQVAAKNGLDFEISCHKSLPESITTDPQRLQQVIRNLLSNALKFTKKGKVTFEMKVATGGWSADNAILNAAEKVIAFSVNDTGIGIAKDKQRLIFEAFQQADGTTSRKFGGTGLGLSISREIARLLSGEIGLESEPNKGSTFTLYLPLTYSAPVQKPASNQLAVEQSMPRQPQVLEASEPVEKVSLELPAHLSDDREYIKPSDKVVLIIEDDEKFARIMLDTARAKGFKGIIALRGDTGLALAKQLKPDAITLDIKLPEISGWTILDLLKHDANLRHIPVHILSSDEAEKRSLRSGAVSFLEKPQSKDALDALFQSMKGFVDKKMRNLLIVEDNEVQRKSLIELIGNGDVKTTAVATAKQALTHLKKTPFDCMVLDLGLPDMNGFKLIDKIKDELGLKQLPIVVYTGRELTQKEETQLKKVAETIIIKDAKSPERLLDETALFLHRVEANLPEQKRELLKQIHDQDPALLNRKVLIVDDDVRNIFALSSLLEEQNMDIKYTESGKEAIELLKKHPEIEIVLMDIMMPDMDGHKAMRAIRKMEQFKKLPMIAVTAKAMKGDREKCIESGASDYITKPIDTRQLLSLLRVWLYK